MHLIAEEMHQRGYNVLIAKYDQARKRIEQLNLSFTSTGNFTISESEMQQKLKGMALETADFNNILTLIIDWYVITA